MLWCTKGRTTEIDIVTWAKHVRQTEGTTDTRLSSEERKKN